METFLRICTDLGLDDIPKRKDQLRCAIASSLYDSVLFFICGYDFIYDPHDERFDGIMQLFIAADGPYAINIYPGCRGALQALLHGPEVAVHIEGTAGDPSSPGYLGHRYTRFTHAAGVSHERNAANYNLQTRALELAVTHPEGLSKQDTVGELRKHFATAMAANRTSPFHAQTVSEMREHLGRYWGADVTRLGL